MVAERVGDGDRALEVAPASEEEVVALFSSLAESRYGLCIEQFRRRFPDCLARRGRTPVRIEFEYRSSHFLHHEHDPGKCDCIVCWEHDWPAMPAKLELIELRNLYGQGANVWISPVRAPYWEHLSKAQSSTHCVVEAEAARGDLLLFYRTSPRCSITDVFQITGASLGQGGGEWRAETRDWLAEVGRVCALDRPLSLAEMRGDKALAKGGFRWSRIRGRVSVRPHWPRLREMLVERNPGVEGVLGRLGGGTASADERR